MPKKKEFNKFRSEMPDAEWNGRVLVVPSWVLAVTSDRMQKSNVSQSRIESWKLTGEMNDRATEKKSGMTFEGYTKIQSYLRSWQARPQKQPQKILWLA